MEQDQQKSRTGEKEQELGEYLFPPCSSTGEVHPVMRSQFQDGVYRYYREHGRSLPWRDSCDPYEILVSEMMLQQTQVSRVLPKYHAFLDRFPTLNELSRSSLAEVFSLWQGLGYNRRAQALLQIARQCPRGLPDTREELLQLPMVGPATSAAVLAFAWNRPVLYLETNIRRVLLYAFFYEQQEVYDRTLYPVLEYLLDRDNPKQWYYALMDYGVYLTRLLPNPNRRSAHYTRQAPYQNSNRHVRGTILLILNERGPVRLDELVDYASFDPDRVRETALKLEQEGFIEIDRPNSASEEEPSYGEWRMRIPSNIV